MVQTDDNLIDYLNISEVNIKKFIVKSIMYFKYFFNKNYNSNS